MSEWGSIDYANNVPKYLQNNTPYANSVYLVDAGRLANSVQAKAAHQGWVKVYQEVGYIANVTITGTNTSLRYDNTYLSIVGSNTTPANAQLVVYGGNNLTIVMNNVGVGYNAVPTITSPVVNSNNSLLTFSVVPGGRLGRVRSEVLVALSTPTVTNANSGLPNFPGL